MHCSNWETKSVGGADTLEVYVGENVDYPFQIHLAMYLFVCSITTSTITLFNINYDKVDSCYIECLSLSARPDLYIIDVR